MAKRKVCHLTSVHSPYDTRIFLKECTTLASGGFETHLVATGDGDEEKNGVLIHLVPKVQGGRLARMTKTVWGVYQKARAIDAEIYHFHDPELITVGLLMKMQGKKVVYDVHEDVPRQILSKHYINKNLRKIISRTFEVLENFAAKRFDAVVTSTPHIRERFRKIGCRAVNINNYPILKELQAAEADWSKKERAVCYIGGITATRGIYEMIEAVGQTDIKLLLAGQFMPASQRDKAVNMPGWQNVDELGQLNRQEVKETLAKSMAGLVALHPIINFIDALPIKMFEYMSAGIPVIASDFPLWKEIVDKNACGICVDPLNISELTRAITWMVEHPEEAKVMGAKGREAVEAVYNWEAEGQRLITTYKELMS